MGENLTKELKKRELIRMFEPIEGEMSLIEASVKFNYTINKTPALRKKWVTGDAATEGCEQIWARTDLRQVSHHIAIDNYLLL